jgi:hypothetical protein
MYFYLHRGMDIFKALWARKFQSDFFLWFNLVITNDANARTQDLMALFIKVQSTEQRLENSTRSLEARQNMTFLKLLKDKINRGRLNIFGLINIVFHSLSKVKVKSQKKIGLKFSCPKGLKYIHSSMQIEIHVYGLLENSHFSCTNLYWSNKKGDTYFQCWSNSFLANHIHVFLFA